MYDCSHNTCTRDIYILDGSDTEPVLDEISCGRMGNACYVGFITIAGCITMNSALEILSREVWNGYWERYKFSQYKFLHAKICP